MYIVYYPLNQLVHLIYIYIAAIYPAQDARRKQLWHPRAVRATHEEPLFFSLLLFSLSAPFSAFLAHKHSKKLLFQRIPCETCCNLFPSFQLTNGRPILAALPS
jgi:hypothetical protein